MEKRLGVYRRVTKMMIKLEKLNELGFYIITVSEVSRNNDADGFGDTSFFSKQLLPVLLDVDSLLTINVSVTK